MCVLRLQSKSAFGKVRSTCLYVANKMGKISKLATKAQRLHSMRTHTLAMLSRTHAVAADGDTGADGSVLAGGCIVVAAPLEGPDLAVQTSPTATAGSRADSAAEDNTEGTQGVPRQTLLHAKELSLWTPDGSICICRGLDLRLVRGMSVLVVGRSGCGKSSLLRSFSGLWRRGSGALDPLGVFVQCPTVSGGCVWSRTPC